MVVEKGKEPQLPVGNVGDVRSLTTTTAFPAARLWSLLLLTRGRPLLGRYFKPTVAPSTSHGNSWLPLLFAIPSPAPYECRQCETRVKFFSSSAREPDLMYHHGDGRQMMCNGGLVFGSDLYAWRQGGFKSTLGNSVSGSNKRVCPEHLLPAAFSILTRCHGSQPRPLSVCSLPVYASQSPYCLTIQR